MATTKKNAPVSRKKSLKSYRQNYKEPLPDFLKAIGTEEGEVSAPPAAARPSAQPRGQVATPISSIQTQQPAVPGERSLVRHPGGEAAAKQLVRDTPPPTGDAEEAYADDAESERKAIIDVDADDVADLSEEGISQDVTAAEGSAVQPFPVNASPPPRPKARKIPHNTPPAPATAPSLPHQSRPKKSMMDSLTAPIKRMTLPQP
ncbi:hypothetical protein OAN22_01365 [Alphaproteobacteria bacterium]|nr:hypothetical protein [Alphaproteobacteria bacterium]